MNVADVMTPREDLVTATVPGSREDVLDVLQERRFSSVPIVKATDQGEVFRGIVSRERLIEEPNEDQLALLIEEIESIAPDASLEELARHMATSGERRIPVVDGGLSGIVTITDIVRSIADERIAIEEPVGDFASDRVHTTHVGVPLEAARQGLNHADEPYGVVLDDHGDMTGIFTEVDIIELAEVVEDEEGTGDSIAGQDSEWAWEGIKAVGNRVMTTRNVELPDVAVGEIMTNDLVTVPRHRSVTDTAQLMIRHDIEQIPLLRGGALGGIVKDMHLLGALYE